MPRYFKKARQINNLKVIKAAEKLGISQPTLSAWEGERKSPSVEGFEKMSDLYGVTTDFLLGRSEQGISVQSVPVPSESLPIFNGKPVWSAKHGWMLVNTINHTLMLSNGQTIPFSDAQKLFTLPQLFSEPSLPSGKPLVLSEIRQFTQIWLEPISPDSDLRTELHGWYQVKKYYVQNEYGNRFYLDTYEAKWLAFHPEQQ
ncbi:helix-turn-helix domain-containing protein [Ruminococcus gauvreauii]|uniref:Helix-turn-helix domain-containing protein n=1 Tax=Ruminococcus gauvreauii TaxID=438033 RepID=A0ABY5VBU6_9FIRM|nr:helix-turn-helix transcriptional regulator [Ruminococcus gauvreauii]UWP57885.1 helix-turn-helix domain-containing protein [Ruminococcus gauvreauii]